MKRTPWFICALFLLTSLSVFGQNTLLTINGNPISKEEFVRIYNKNKHNYTTGEDTPVDEYLDLFINFKLKVLEAQNQGIDTTRSFLQEFNNYKKQLSLPYLTDNETNERFIKEAYDRMQYEVRASHILIKLAPDAPPKDTLVAYEKAMEIRRRILNGEPFDIVAKGTSDDPSVKNNGGDLGYFTVFQMIYPFESAVYNNEVGTITYPVRTRFGYHIIKIVDKRKANGRIKVAHIMLLVPQGTSSDVEKQKKALINELYHRIKQGEDFAELAKQYSDDKGSARNGGELPWFGAGRMVVEFENASFALNKNGEVSQPVKTSFGWHLIKRLDREEIPSFEDAKAEIKLKITKGKRPVIAKNALIHKLKKEYNFNEKEENLPFVFDTTKHVYIIKQEFLNPDSNLDDTIFSFLGRTYFQKDYVNYIQEQGQKELRPYDYKLLYDEFVSEEILKVEEARLEEKYPDYKYLLKEYHDGMLLFEISDQKIWSKAVDDSVGLRKYYEENKKSYMWGERWKGSLYFCSNNEVYDNVSKIINKRKFGKKITNKDLLAQFNAKEDLLRIETGIYSKGENNFVDYLVFGKKESEIDAKLVLHKGDIIPPETKTFEESKGYVISDYQEFLDKEWVKSLRNKYDIKINQAILSSIK